MDLTIVGGMGGRRRHGRAAGMAQGILSKDPSAKAIVASGYTDDPAIARYRDVGFVAAFLRS